MPAIKCNNGKWKWGEKGKCIYETKKDAEDAGIAITIQENDKVVQRKKIIQLDKRNNDKARKK